VSVPFVRQGSDYDRTLGRHEQGSAMSKAFSGLHRSIFSGITLCATKGHTLFLNETWTEHYCREVCFRCNSPLVKTPSKVGN
jgi:hypothetical protein